MHHPSAEKSDKQKKFLVLVNLRFPFFTPQDAARWHVAPGWTVPALRLNPPQARICIFKVPEHYLNASTRWS